MADDIKFNYHIDLAKVKQDLGYLTKQITQDLNNALETAASVSFAKANEMAAQQLTTTAKIYREALTFEQVGKSHWVVSLDLDKAGWIEHGMEAGRFMEWLLRGKSSKQGKNGRYAIIPFDQAKAPSQQTDSEFEANKILKSFLRKNKVSYKKIEKNPDGSPKLGKLHTFDIASGRPTVKAKHDKLESLNIYQTKTTSGKIKRSFVTFRVITEKHRSDGRWYHPGRKGVYIINQTFEFIKYTLDRDIIPAILEKYK